MTLTDIVELDSVTMLTEGCGAEQLEACYAEHVEKWSGYNTETLARLLVAIRDERAALATFSDRVEQDLLALMGEKSLNIEGLGLVEAKKKTTYRKWDNDALWRLVTAYALDERKLDEATGEYEDAGQAVARVLGECARPGWRLTPLRARGIAVDEYCEVEEDGWQIKLPARSL